MPFQSAPVARAVSEAEMESEEGSLVTYQKRLHRNKPILKDRCATQNKKKFFKSGARGCRSEATWLGTHSYPCLAHKAQAESSEVQPPLATGSPKPSMVPNQQPDSVSTATR